MKNGVILKNGKPRYIHPSVTFDGKGYNLTTIGNDVVISRNVLLLNHDYSLGAGYRAINMKSEGDTPCILRNITIGNNCFIGANCTILPGVSLEDNSIVGAGSVLRGKYPENCIIMGNPAKILGNTTQWIEKKIKKEEI